MKVTRHLYVLPLLALAVHLNGCSKTKPEKLAPEGKMLQEELKKEQEAIPLQIDSQASQVSFQMNAALEKITGRAPLSVAGTLYVDAKDLAKSTALARVDLKKLTIYQEKRSSEEEDYGELKKSDLQNEHMRTWLQISEDGPSEEVEKNRYLEFQIHSLKDLSAKSLQGLKGTTTKVSATAQATLRLHGRITNHEVPLLLSFQYENGVLTGLKAENEKPLPVSLAQHDVHPRKAFGILAEKTLSALGAKVAKTADVEFDIVAKVGTKQP
ncbi:MAG: YceI family protein [Polyangiaceae bacterium]|nr:YceI family protein [Polyangiaceae bacterium]